MGFDVKLCHNLSPVEKIGKNIDTGETFSGCVLKDETSILKPTIRLLTNSDIHTYNYMYIPAFERYYFIDDIVSVNNNKWEISGHVDVLETYKNSILANNAVIKRQANQYNTYLNDSEWSVFSYDDVITFKFSPSGFQKALSYLLVVAGG